jgi:hypothetical protein
MEFMGMVQPMIQLYPDAVDALDIAVVTLALADFNSLKNTEALHNTIMCMDTCIRERFINTLLYIEENALIPANSYCCV